MKDEIREIVASYCKEPVENITDSDIIEVITECFSTVWEDGSIDMHRWYGMQDVVVEHDGIFIAYSKYIITGDNGMGDMDLEYSVEDFQVVYKKVRTIEEIYYS